MIIWKKGSIFDSAAQVLVCPCNTVGTMGAGLAKDFRERFQDAFETYYETCKTGNLRTGDLLLVATDGPSVLCFPTKRHWRFPSKVEWITQGLITFRKRYQPWGIAHVAFPKLGCGFGGLEWSEVKPVMEHYLDDLPIGVEVYV